MSQVATLISIASIALGMYLFYPSEEKVIRFKLEKEISSYCELDSKSFPNTINANYSSLVACRIADIREYPSIHDDQTTNSIPWGFDAINQVHPKIVEINDRIFSYCRDYGGSNKKNLAISYFSKLKSIEQENVNRVLDGEITFGAYEKLRGGLNGQLLSVSSNLKSDDFCRFHF